MVHTLDDLPLQRIERVTVTNRSGTVSVLSSPQMIALWLGKVGNAAIEWRKDYDAWCSTMSGKAYAAFQVKVKP